MTEPLCWEIFHLFSCFLSSSYPGHWAAFHSNIWQMACFHPPLDVFLKAKWIPARPLRRVFVINMHQWEVSISPCLPLVGYAHYWGHAHITADRWSAQQPRTTELHFLSAAVKCPPTGSIPRRSSTSKGLSGYNEIQVTQVTRTRWTEGPFLYFTLYFK